MNDGFRYALDAAVGYFLPQEFARKPASGQLGFNFEEDHPREKSSHDGKKPGEFSPKSESNPSTVVDNNNPPADTTPVAPDVGAEKGSGVEDRKMADTKEHISRFKVEIPYAKSEIREAAKKLGARFDGRTKEWVFKTTADADKIRDMISGKPSGAGKVFSKTTTSTTFRYQVGGVIHDASDDSYHIVTSVTPRRADDHGKFQHEATTRPATADEAAKAKRDSRIAALKSTLDSTAHGPDDERDRASHDARRRLAENELRTLEGRPSLEAEEAAKAASDPSPESRISAAKSALKIDRDAKEKDEDGDEYDARPWGSIVRGLSATGKPEFQHLSINMVMKMTDEQIANGLGGAR